MRELIEDMMLLARLESEGPADGELADVTAAVDDCRRATRRRRAARLGLTAGRATPPRGIVTVVPRRLVDVVLDNLVENAIRHAGEGADVDVTRPRPGRGGRAVEVADTGAGIPPSTCRGCSSASTASRARAPAPARDWAWRSSSTSPRRTAAAR